MSDDIVEQLTWLRDEFYDVDSVTSIVDLAMTEINRLCVALDAGRALADQLAVALAAQGSASFDEDTNLNIKRLALDAFKEARRG